ncbi:MAG: MgtC/SapB family protein [Lachnospiraceae bacterium]|nr:MgtC/SapB family protein [Lachnospiraceae bacterium]
MGNTAEAANGLSLFCVTCRLLFAMLAGMLVGIERSSRGRGAGVKTHTLVCVGAALVMLIGQYMNVALGNQGDMARLGAQVISGMGFLGVGTIIVTGRNHVRGLTTAAGLWVCACEGLAIGIGFWKGAAVTLIIIMFTLRVLVRVDLQMHRNANSFDLYIEFNGDNSVRQFMQDISCQNVRIKSLDVTRSRIDENGQAAIIGFEMRRGKDRPNLLEWIRERKYILYLEEL